MRTLPRLSASQAVGNFRDIYSEKNNGQGKYRHVSTIDFHKSQEIGKYKKKTSFNGNEDLHSKMIASSDGLCTNDNGFSSITPIGVSHHERRKVAQANFCQSGRTVTCNEGPPNSGIIDIKNDADVNLASQKRSLEDT